MILDRRTALVVLETGSPTEAAEVEPWLEAVYRDRRGYRLPWYKEPLRQAIAAKLALRRGPAWQEDLENIALDSPLQRVTQAQAHGIAERLGCEGYAAVLFGMPSISEAIDLIRAEGMERCLLLPIEPQSPDQGRAAVDEFCKVWASSGGAAEAVQRVPDWSKEPEILEAMVMHFGETLALGPAQEAPVVLLARDPGRSFAAPDFESSTLAGHDRLVQGLGIAGRCHSAWLEPRHDDAGLQPDAKDLIAKLGENGHERVVILPTGWVADRFETLYDVDMLLARVARDSGMRTFRAPTLNDRPEFLDALATVCARAASPGSD